VTITQSAERAETESAGAVIHPGQLFPAQTGRTGFRQRFLHQEAGLQFLDTGQFELPVGTRTQEFCLPARESLLFQWKGRSVVTVGGRDYELAPYDTLYVPLGAAFSLSNPGLEPASLMQTSAPAERAHSVFHSPFATFSRREERIRRLQGKSVYLMFDVCEAADKLVAGYTFFEPYSRSWPPHNHTDQEETYIFIKGRGSMEVYESPEKLTFVHNVGEGDLVTIPFLNYHPVFSQAEPLEFIWCIAGERYWIGDKNKSFLSGSGGPITT
jgi:mannose-6-phosphate isomerase-like protein (cupin superfamily)